MLRFHRFAESAAGTRGLKVKPLQPAAHAQVAAMLGHCAPAHCALVFVMACRYVLGDKTAFPYEHCQRSLSVGLGYFAQFFDDILSGFKTSPDQLKAVAITPAILAEQSGLRREIILRDFPELA